MKKYVIGVIIGLMLGASGIVFAQTVKVFPDVAQDAYYYGAVDRMNALGVITGYQNGNFGPDDAVTRGQMATMMNRYDQNVILQLNAEVTRLRKLQTDQLKGKPWAEYLKVYAYFPYDMREAEEGFSAQIFKEIAVLAYDGRVGGEGIRIYADTDWKTATETSFYIEYNTDFAGPSAYGPFYDNVQNLVNEIKAGA
jgi:hypothetical protein